MKVIALLWVQIRTALQELSEICDGAQRLFEIVRSDVGELFERGVRAGEGGGSALDLGFEVAARLRMLGGKAGIEGGYQQDDAQDRAAAQSDRYGQCMFRQTIAGGEADAGKWKVRGGHAGVMHAANAESEQGRGRELLAEQPRLTAF